MTCRERVEFALIREARADAEIRAERPSFSSAEVRVQIDLGCCHADRDASDVGVAIWQSVLGNFSKFLKLGDKQHAGAPCSGQAWLGPGSLLSLR